MDRRRVRREAPRYAATRVDGQRKTLSVWACWATGLDPYLTMDFKTEANIIRARQNHRQRSPHEGAKPVHWCVDCRSALAEAEVEYYDKTSRPLTLLFRWSIRMY
ncbi:class I tRNA ligase family protein [Shigella flexneri]